MSPDQSSTIQRLQAALEDARNANATKDRFIAIAAHELRQPLAALMLQAESLRRMGLHREDEFLQELGSDLRATARRQARLICDLVDLARARTGKLQLCAEDVDVGALVKRVVTTMALVAPAVDVQFDIGPAETLVCRADAIRVEQMVSNLMENALKFAGPIGRINVKVATDEEFACISIADNGRGIMPDDIDTLFQMFGNENEPNPSDSSEPGMGIGLALVHELADAHRGYVRAHSDGPGLGAAFSVWLPLCGNDDGIQANDDATRFNGRVGTSARHTS